MSSIVNNKIEELMFLLSKKYDFYFKLEKLDQRKLIEINIPDFSEKEREEAFNFIVERMQKKKIDNNENILKAFLTVASDQNFIDGKIKQLFKELHQEKKGKEMVEQYDPDKLKLPLDILATFIDISNPDNPPPYYYRNELTYPFNMIFKMKDNVAPLPIPLSVLWKDIEKISDVSPFPEDFGIIGNLALTYLINNLYSSFGVNKFFYEGYLKYKTNISDIVDKIANSEIYKPEEVLRIYAKDVLSSFIDKIELAFENYRIGINDYIFLLEDLLYTKYKRKQYKNYNSSVAFDDEKQERFPSFIRKFKSDPFFNDMNEPIERKERGYMPYRCIPFEMLRMRYFGDMGQNEKSFHIFELTNSPYIGIYGIRDKEMYEEWNEDITFFDEYIEKSLRKALRKARENKDKILDYFMENVAPVYINRYEDVLEEVFKLDKTFEFLWIGEEPININGVKIYPIFKTYLYIKDYLQEQNKELER